MGWPRIALNPLAKLSHQPVVTLRALEGVLRLGTVRREPPEQPIRSAKGFPKPKSMASPKPEQLAKGTTLWVDLVEKSERVENTDERCLPNPILS